MNENHKASNVNLWASETTALLNTMLKWENGKRAVYLRFWIVLIALESSYHGSRDSSDTKDTVNRNDRLQEIVQMTGYGKSWNLVKTMND